MEYMKCKSFLTHYFTNISITGKTHANVSLPPKGTVAV